MCVIDTNNNKKINFILTILLYIKNLKHKIKEYFLKPYLFIYFFIAIWHCLKIFIAYTFG